MSIADREQYEGAGRADHVHSECGLPFDGAIHCQCATEPEPELPELHAERENPFRGGYRLFDIEYVPFDHFPPYRDGGPAKVVIDGWCVSYGSLSRAMSSQSVIDADDGMVTLSAFRFTEHHELDGSKYPTQRDAERAAYEAGLTAFMVYEQDRAVSHG